MTIGPRTYDVTIRTTFAPYDSLQTISPANYQPRHDHGKVLTSQMTLKRSRNTDTSNRAEITTMALKFIIFIGVIK